jgi:hypothetical protein
VGFHHVTADERERRNVCLKSKSRLSAALDSCTGVDLLLVALPVEQFADG